MASYLLGVDLGTSAVKATLVAADVPGVEGIVATAGRQMNMRQPQPGQAEQDPDAYVAAALAAIAEVVARADVAAGEVAAVAFSGQMGGAMAVDRQGAALTPWFPSTLDMRYLPYLQGVMAEAGPRILALSGATPILAPRIAWWRAEQPQTYRRIAKVLILANYVAAQLGGLTCDAVCSDPSYLTWTGLADTGRRQWSQELADLWGVDRALLPRLVSAHTVVGQLSPAAAAACGLAAGTPLVAGAGDQVAGFLGAGLVRPGQLIDVAGTFGVFATCLDRFLVDQEHGILQALAGPLGEDHWYAMMYIGGGGLTHHWFAEQLGGGDYAALDAAAGELPPGVQGLLFIPHLLGRACPPDPSVRGAWLGFTWTHTRAHFYRALLESIAYDYAGALAVLREKCPETPFDTVRVIGGGARSALWNQIKADVLGVAYTRLAEGDRAALGCAILAGGAVGIYPDMAAVSGRFAAPEGLIVPRPAWHAHYRGYVDAYRTAFDQLRAVYGALGELGRRPWPPDFDLPPAGLA
jgi:xylulokinase